MQRDKMLEVLFKRYAGKTNFIKDMMCKNKVSKKEASIFIESLGLESIHVRYIFMKDIDNKLEKLINDMITLGDYDSIVRELYKYITGKYSDLSLTLDNVKMLVYIRGFRTVNDMRSFKAICDGDLETYDLFSMGKKELLINSVQRYMVLRKLDIEMIKSVCKLIEGEVRQNKEITECDRLLRRDYGKDMQLVGKYVELSKSLDLIFLSGIEEILKTILAESTEKEMYDSIFGLSEEVKSEVQVEVVPNTEGLEGTGWLELALDSLNSNNNVNVDNVEKLEKVPIPEDEVEEKGCCTEWIKLEDNELMEMACEDNSLIETDETSVYENLDIKMKEMLEIVEQIKEDKSKVVTSDVISEIEDLKRENEMLRNELESQKRKKQGVSLKQFIQRIGGKDAGYQLSELYMISDDIIADDSHIPGRLVNMFNVLEGCSLEVYYGGKSINEEFEIERRELATGYSLEMPLRGDSENVCVKLIRNGWKLNGEVVVLPLVKQI